MADPARILVVDDDPRLRDMLRRYLEQEGFAVALAADGAAMRKALAERTFDLALLDLVLPGEDGLLLARDIRAQSDLPIIILSGKGDTIDRVVGLEVGADDYIAKPFHLRELLARMRTVLRRTAKKPEAPAPAAAEGVLAFESWRLDPSRRELRDGGGRLVELTSGEFDLLLCFVRRPQRVLSRDQIMDFTRGRGWSPLDRSIDNQVRRLRRKMEADPDAPQLIKTVRGAGYVFTAAVSPAR
jgi:two-component system, OmpR family, response regulator